MPGLVVPFVEVCHWFHNNCSNIHSIYLHLSVILNPLRKQTTIIAQRSFLPYLQYFSLKHM